MANMETQRQIVDTISKVVDLKMGQTGFVSNKVGYVLDDPTGYQCVVKVGQDDVECLLPEHLQTWIQKDDVVMIQDSYGDGHRYTVVGKTGARMATPSLVFSDDETNKNISGVDGIFMGDEKLNTTGTINI